ncbi:hypothetical protein BGM26_13095 [Bacillus sp. FJAT-29790]|uniref:hypothetical protein n=1 Tax=Bacillus sp. FJAT-29790 TaxID=1895002 RepID=UPI001C21B0F2|nr:hypothetical protein [Bacillus sp. FJAT-29790]MBU8879916.1 hypothetical protein [Bacillus sp. FJAT-29790]
MTPRKCYRFSFVRGQIQGCKFSIQREIEGTGDPTGGNAEEAPVPPRGKQVPAAEINGQNLKAKNNNKTVFIYYSMIIIENFASD